MTDTREARRTNAAWLTAAVAVLLLGVAVAVVSGAAVVDRLWFVEDAIALKAPGRYRVTAARASTWTLLQELGPNGALTSVRARVRALAPDVIVDVKRSAAAYRFSRAGTAGFSAYDFHLPGAGDYEIELSSGASVNLRLIDDVKGRLGVVRRGLVRTAALAAGAFALALAFVAIAFLVPPRRARRRVLAPNAAVSSGQRRASPARPQRSLQVLPALPTSIALERYKLPAPKKHPAAHGRPRQERARIPSVA